MRPLRKSKWYDEGFADGKKAAYMELIGKKRNLAIHIRKGTTMDIETPIRLMLLSSDRAIYLQGTKGAMLLTWDEK